MTRLITQAELDGFAGVSGDHNPIHTDPQFAASTPFGKPVAHGMFLVSLVCAELGRRWPGHRVSGIDVMFPSPTPVDTRVDIRLTPRDPEASGAPGTVSAEIVTADGEAGLRGEFTLTPGPVSDSGGSR